MLLHGSKLQGLHRQGDRFEGSQLGSIWGRWGSGCVFAGGCRVIFRDPSLRGKVIGSGDSEVRDEFEWASGLPPIIAVP